MKINTNIFYNLLFTILFLWNSTVFAETTEKVVTLTGYAWSCSEPLVYKPENDHWVGIDQLPNKGGYFLDGKFKGYSMCDVMACQPITSPFVVKTVEYKMIGKRDWPKDSGFHGGKADVYQSSPLQGKIMIDFNYSSDPECKKHIKYLEIFTN